MKRVGVYTSEDEKKYPKIDKDNLVNRVGVCPNCKEQNLEYGAVEFEDDMAYFPYECSNCGLKGEEWYNMEFSTHIVEDENGNDIELD